MSDDGLTRAIEEAQQEIEDLCPHEADEHAEGCCDVCDLTFAAGSVLDDLAASLAPLIVQREQRAFDRGYDKAMEGIEARVHEAEAVAWQEGYDAARGMARCYGHTDHWEGAPENPYRRAES